MEYRQTGALQLRITLPFKPQKWRLRAQATASSAPAITGFL